MTRRVLLFGHYGGNNSGDEAMLSGLLDGFLARNCSITVVGKSTNEYASSLPAGVDLVPVGVWTVLRQVCRADVVALGGGTHFHDDYPPRRLVRHLRYMAAIAGLTVVARAAGKRTVWLGVGLGPMQLRVTRLLARVGLAACHAVSVREAGSLAEVRGWACGSKVSVAFDPAVLIGLEEPEPPRQPVRTLGICVMPIGARTSSAANPGFLRMLEAELKGVLARRSDLNVSVLVIRGGFREDDNAASEKLVETLSVAAPERVRLVSYQGDVAVLMDELGRCDALVGMRFHSVLLAYLCGRPVLALAYHRKLLDLAREIGLPRDASVDLAEPFARESLRERLERLVDHPEAFGAQMPVDKAVARARISLDLAFAGPAR